MNRYQAEVRLSPARRLALCTALAVCLLPASAAHAGGTPVWIGAPLAGKWPTAAGCAGATYPSAACSLPPVHHTFRWSNPAAGDWGYDQQGVSNGSAVRLYAAPKNTTYNNQITARVQWVGTACTPTSGESSASTLGRGGRAVTVAIYHGSSKIGTVAFVHVNTSLRGGEAIARWGGQIGTVGSYTRNSCWTGVHVHAELFNASGYACYNGTWSAGQSIVAGNYIGYLGGTFASAPRRPCPAGA